MQTLESRADQSTLRRVMRVIAEALFLRARPAANQQPPVEERPCGRVDAKTDPCPAKAIRRRLNEEAAYLEHLDSEREQRGDSLFGKTAEDRIVWGELIELELQEVDEQATRICDAAAGEHGRP